MRFFLLVRWRYSTITRFESLTDTRAQLWRTFVSELIQIAFKSFSLECCNFYLEIVP